MVASLQSEKLKMEELLGIIQEKVTTLEGNHAEAFNENSSLRQSLITNEDHLKFAAEMFQKMKSEYGKVFLLILHTLFNCIHVLFFRL